MLAGFGSLPVIIAMLFVGNAFLGLVMPTTMVMALDPHPDIAGLASSLGGTLQMLTGGVMIALAGPFFDGTATPMVATIALAGCCSPSSAALTLRTLRAARRAGRGRLAARRRLAQEARDDPAREARPDPAAASSSSRRG